MPNESSDSHSLLSIAKEHNEPQNNKKLRFLCEFRCKKMTQGSSFNFILMGQNDLKNQVYIKAMCEIRGFFLFILGKIPFQTHFGRSSVISVDRLDSVC